MPEPTRNASRRISRRAVLRGTGVSIALPWLESLPTFGNTRTAPTFPQRFGVVFMGNGVNEDHWSAEGTGSEMQLSKTLSVLEPLKRKINVIDGLFNKAATGLGIHPAQTGSLLSGAEIQKGAVIKSGVSVDQMIANRIGGDTPLSSLVLACEQPMTGYHETNFSMAYSSHISWRTAGSPVPVEVYPSLAFDSLFENRGSLRNISILDRAKDRAEALSGRISASDKSKLDEFLTSVREVERRVEGLRKAADQAKGAPRDQHTETMDRPPVGLPEDLRDHTRLMCDLVAIALQTDRTRVASLILARDLSALYYPFLEVKKGHHSQSHDNLTPEYERIARFHLGQFAHLAEKLDRMPEGEGTVLDNSCLMFLSNMWIGRLHDNSKLPVVLAGGMGGTLETGRALSYLDASEEDRKMCSLYLSLMDRMGVRLERFGDADSRLQRL